MEQFLFHIGDLNISLILDTGLLERLPSDSYAEFLLPATEATGEAPIQLHISPEPFTPPAATRLFKGGDAWTLSEADDQYIIYWAGWRGDPHPLWTARLDRAFTRIKVHFPPPRQAASASGADRIAMSLYPMDQLLLMHILVNNQGLILHAAGGTIGGRGMIFAGKSGAGKTTLARMLTTVSGHELYSDDRMVVRRIDGTWQAFGTPWPGDAGIAKNKRIDLAALVFMRQAEEPSWHRLSAGSALAGLLPVSAIPWHGKEWVDKALAVCDDLIRDIPMYELAFSLDRAATVEAIEDLAAHLG